MCRKDLNSTTYCRRWNSISFSKVFTMLAPIRWRDRHDVNHPVNNTYGSLETPSRLNMRKSLECAGPAALCYDTRSKLAIPPTAVGAFRSFLQNE
jgi:hypothetical protein